MEAGDHNIDAGIAKTFPTAPVSPAPGPSYDHRTVSVYCTSCGRSHPVTMKCGRRSCPECRRKDYWRLLGRYSSPLTKYHSDARLTRGAFKLLTLTVRNIKSTGRKDQDIRNLRTAARNLAAAFNRMRRWKILEGVFKGGLRVTEIVRSPGGDWNVHAHVLYEGGYFDVCCQAMKDASSEWEIKRLENYECPSCPSKCFRYLWRKASGCPVLDVRRAWSPRKGLRYILKYLSKPARCGDAVDIFDEAMKGMRLIQPFGTWSGLEIEPPCMVCESCGGTAWISEYDFSYLDWLLSTPYYASALQGTEFSRGFRKVSGLVVGVPAPRTIRPVPFSDQIIMDFSIGRLARVH